VSAKTGQGVPDMLEKVVELVPPPSGDPDAPLQALIFDLLRFLSRRRRFDPHQKRLGQSGG
jgi:hypothetical protein